MDAVSDTSTMVALYPPEEVEEAVRDLSSPEQDLHLTLVYLGELTEREAREAASAIWMTRLRTPDAITVDGWGLLKRLVRPRPPVE